MTATKDARHTELSPSGIGLPLLEDRLQKLFDKFNTPEAGRSWIQRIRSELPERAAQSTKTSGKVRYPSLKMGFVLEAEAFHTELVALTEWDHDTDTLELYSQPAGKLKLTYKTAAGRPANPWYTPDAFRISSQHGFIYTECKTEAFLIENQVLQPERYVRSEDGTWRCPPAEVAAAKLGCRFELRSTSQNNYVAFENIELLEDFYKQKKPIEVSSDARALLESKLSATNFASAFEIIHTAPFLSADDLYAMLVAGEVYFPLCDLRLTDQDTAFFFRSRAAWDAHKLFLASKCDASSRAPLPTDLRVNDVIVWSGISYQVLNPGTTVTARALTDQKALITLTAKEFETLWGKEIKLVRADCPESPNEAYERYRRASPDDLQEARWRWELLFSEPSEGNKLVDRKERIRYVWLRDYREAQQNWQNGFLGLLADRHGNREPKADPVSIALAKKVIEEDWETIRRKKRLTSYGTYGDRCGALVPVSYSTFCRFVKERAGHQQDVARVGEKAAYDSEPQFLALERTTPRHGTHSWHIGHIDHTPLPLQLVGKKFKGLASTLWLSILITAHDRKIRAYYLSFDEPSFRTNMMVLRDCVRRHGRVPQYVISDGGSDFQSEDYEKLLARLGVKKRERPRGKPKFGSVCERYFGTSQSQMVTNLLGATDIVEQHFRAISPEVDPKHWAVWVLDRVDQAFEDYLNKIYHPNHHSGIDMSPDEAEALSLRSHGQRPFVPIPYDEQFIAETCPSARRGGRAKVCPQGIKMDYRWFDSTLLHQPGVLGSHLFAKQDPWNGGRGFAYLKGRWEEVRSELYAVFKDRSAREIQFATSALRAVARQRNEKAVINARTIAAFLGSAEGEEATAIQARNDAEAADHRQKINTPAAVGRKAAKAGEQKADPIWPSSPATGNVIPFSKPKSKPLEDL